MTDKELNNWFFNKIDSCYKVIIDDLPESIFFYYDISYTRKMKICKINNQNISLQNKNKGICLFEQNIITKKLYCNYPKIWVFMQKNYTGKKNIYDFINDILYHNNNFYDCTVESRYFLEDFINQTISWKKQLTIINNKHNS